MSPLEAYLREHPDQVLALRAYRREARNKVVAEKGVRRPPLRGRKSEPEPHWTELLYSDFASAGPRQNPGYPVAAWPNLQRLRNSGAPWPAEAFVASVDRILDFLP